MKIAIVQATISMDKQDNIDRLERLVRKAVADDGPDLVILPEMGAAISGDPKTLQSAAEPQDGPYATTMAKLAAELSVNLHLGSLIEQRGERRYNTSMLYGRDGKLIAQYSKIHRFDVSLPNGLKVRESDTVDAGSDIVVADVEGLRVGFSICYDLRFGELYRKLAEAGAELIVAPSAFLLMTGMDHWEVLIRSRAIETQCFLAAPNQIGPVDGGKAHMYGNSMIVDPWGQVIARMSNTQGYVSAVLDMDYRDAVRQRIPVHTHRVLT